MAGYALRIAAGWTECNRQDCGAAEPVVTMGMQIGLGALAVVLAVGIVRLALRGGRRRAG